MLHQISNSSKNYNYNAFVYTNTSWDSHFHDNYELIYALDGDVTVRSATDEYVLHTGELLLIPPSAVHSLHAENAKTWVGVFSDDFVPRFASETKHLRYSKFTLTQGTEEFLKKNLFFTGQPERYMTSACLYAVCSECAERAEVIEDGLDRDFIKATTKFISENIAKEISMHEIAEHLGYEYHYFSALFNRTYGMTFTSFINTYRFNKACMLLSGHEKNITKICDECGFTSIRNFNRVFKKMSGTTPSEYRRK